MRPSETSRVGSQGAGLRPSLKSDAVGAFVSKTARKVHIDLRSMTSNFYTKAGKFPSIGAKSLVPYRLLYRDSLQYSLVRKGSDCGGGDVHFAIVLQIVLGFHLPAKRV